MNASKGIMWAWVPSTGPEPTTILILNNRISNSSHDGIYLFSQGPGSFIPPDPYPLKPLVNDNLIIGNNGAGVFISNAFLGNPTGTADPLLECNSIEDNGWGAINQRNAVINAVNNWWGASSGPISGNRGTGTRSVIILILNPGNLVPLYHPHRG